MSENVAIPAVADLLNLDEQRVLVTGASGNIGRGVALRLAEAGADVVIHYRSDAAGAAQTVEEIIAGGGKAESLQADLTVADDVAAMFGKIDKGGPPLTGTVNNAGAYPVQKFVDMSAVEWQQVVAANLDSAVHVAREAIRRWCDLKRNGTIVNIASIEGSDPAAGHSHYATAKAGLLMLTRSLTLEYGHRGIRVNAISPGLIARPGIGEDWPEGVANWHRQAPLRRMGDASDVADAVLFLLSPASRWISGVNLAVDGGMSTVSRW